MQDDEDGEEEEDILDGRGNTGGLAAHHSTGIEEVFGSDDDDDEKEDETVGSKTGTGTRSEVQCIICIAHSAFGIVGRSVYISQDNICNTTYNVP